jgi:NitT/TauT family transport system substrate-binding protein
MKLHHISATRREFLKTAGKGIALGAITGSTSLMQPVRKAFAGPPVVKFAYILSDHHAPLMVAAKNASLFKEKFNTYMQPVAEGKVYDFFHEGKKAARIQLIATKKGPDVEKLIAQGSVDMAISGTQAILLSIDRAVETRIVSPVQTEGNVFVLHKRLGIQTWNDFVRSVKGRGRRFSIGIPGPHTVAAIIFRSALDHEGVSYSEDAADESADIFFINMKGHGNLVTALSNDLSQGIIGAEPFPSVTIHRGFGQLIVNLADLPPEGLWNSHACCSLEATTQFMNGSPELFGKMMDLMILSIHQTRNDPALTAASCARWLGVSPDVEKIAMQTLSYTSTPNSAWKQSISIYGQTMDKMGLFNGRLSGLEPAALEAKALRLKELFLAKSRLGEKGLLG